MATTLMPEGKQSFAGSAGAPLVGGKLYTYDAGTSTPRTTYQDAAGTVPNTNPVILDARGEATVFWNGNYKVVLRDSADVVIWTVDNINALDLSTPSGSSNIGHIAVGAGAVQTTVRTKLREWVTPEDFGAVGDGVVNDSAAIQLALTASDNVRFNNNKRYLMNSGVTKSANNIEIDFGNAEIINGGVGFLFSFGTTSDTPLYSGARIKGGFFEQSNPATVVNANYIKFAGFEDFQVVGSSLKNVSNGGIYVEAGCENGLIDGVTVDGASGYSTCRGIWLIGATASDWTDQLVDTTSITRNATAFPVYAVKNVRIVNCSVVLPAYGIYNMNTRDTHIENCYIDVSGSGLRCITINNYSPGAVIKGNTLKCDQSATGILVTQCSNNVIIDGNTFLGSFGGGRDIYVTYLADCQITNNRFNTDSSQNILIDMGGTAVIKGNYFNRASGVTPAGRCVLCNTIDEAAAGTGTYGNSATTLPGFTFANNVVKNRLSVVNVRAMTATNGNIPGLDVVTVRDNVLYNFDQATSSDEYGMKISAPGTTYTIAYAYFGNTMYPSAFASRNRADIILGTGAVAIRTDVQLGVFRCVTPAGGGNITGTKLYGGYFSCGGAATLAGNFFTLVPRTVEGNAGAAAATVLEVLDVLGVFASYDIKASGSNYAVRFYDSAGVIINLTTTDVTFDVVIAGSAT